MEYQLENQIPNRIIQSQNIPEEHIIRDMANKFISDLDINEVKKIFNYKKIDPDSIYKEMKHRQLTAYENEYISSYELRHKTTFRMSIFIPK